MISNSMSYRSIHNRQEQPNRKRGGRGGSGTELRLYAIRLLAIAVVFTLLFSGFAIVQSYASNDTPKPVEAGEKTIITSAGDTLWEIATDVKKSGMDTRKAVFLIKERNGLSGGALKSGVTIIIPKSVME